MLEVRGLTRRYGRVTALEDVSVNVARGEGLAVLGPSGAGKTTLLRLIAGLEPPDGGKIGIGGRTVSTPACQVPPWERGIGLVPQHPALWPHMRVADQVAYAAPGGTGAREEALEALARCRVDRLADRYPAELSGGEARRVAIARALAARPALLLMDEPLAHLDAALRETIVSTVGEFRRETGCTLVVAIHDADEGARMAGGWIRLEDGRVAARGGGGP